MKISLQIIGDQWIFVKQKTTHSLEAFKKLSDHDNSSANLQSEKYFSTLTNEPQNQKMQKTH